VNVERLDLVTWSRFLARSSVVLAATWRDIEAGTGGLGFAGAPVAEGEPRRWQAVFRSAERPTRGERLQSPALIEAELKYSGVVAHRFVLTSDETGPAAQLALVDQWTDLLRANVLAQ
jgi:hypothetical protein